MSRNGTIIVKLPYPFKILGATFFPKREIGFSFDQRMLFDLLQNNSIDLPDHGKWIKETPQNVVVLETLYAGAQSFLEKKRKKDNFTKKGLAQAIMEADEGVIKSIVDCWKNSEQLGYKKLPGKKKAEKH
jgi:hypothetical protein